MGKAAVSLLNVALIVTTGVAQGKTFSGKVVAVESGDIITVLRDKQRVQIRLYGVDAPGETLPLGARAKQHSKKTVLGKQVKVEPAARLKGSGSVAWVYYTTFEGIDHYADGSHARVDVTRCLNEELVKVGLAWWDRKQAPKEKRMSTAEAEAKKARRGLWAGAAAGATRPAADLVLQVRVKRVFINRLPRSQLHHVVKTKVLAVLRGAFTGKTFDFRVHSPARAGIGAGSVVFIGARKVGDGYIVPDSSIGPLRGNVKSKVFHAPGCRHYRCKNCTAAFGARREATKKGHRPCDICKP
jgi:micrococcal nuclease